MNQLINVAVAEKLSALRTADYFSERGRRADRAETLRILDRAGRGNPPLEGDELPRIGKEKARSKGRAARRLRKLARPRNLAKKKASASKQSDVSRRAFRNTEDMQNLVLVVVGRAGAHQTGKSAALLHRRGLPGFGIQDSGKTWGSLGLTDD